MILQNYWLTTLTQEEFERPGELPSQVDVAIIGGGLTGLSAALRLSKHGLQTAVLEAQTVGWGASSRNGGMLLTGMKLGMETILKRYGKENARRWFQVSLETIDCVEQIVMEEGIDCDFRRCGHLELACKQTHYDACFGAAEWMEMELGHPLKILDQAEMQAEVESPFYHGAMLDETSAGVNPARLVTGLGRAAARAGAMVFEHTPALAVEKTTSGWRIKTPRGDLLAREVLVASGAYTGSATPVFQQRIVPIGSYIIATAPLSDEQAGRIIRQRRMVFDSKNYLYYFRLSEDQRLVFGGRASFVPESDPSIRKSSEILYKGMLEVFPYLEGVQVDYAWGGTLDFAFDWMPHAGTLDGLRYSFGYAGHGVALAVYLGKQLAEAIITGSDENPYRDLAIPRAPLGSYWAVRPLLPLAGLWYRFKDWVG